MVSARVHREGAELDIFVYEVLKHFVYHYNDIATERVYKSLVCDFSTIQIRFI